MSEKEFDFLAENSPWKDNNSSLWMASTVQLKRNIENFKFPGKLDIERRKQIISLISKELMAVNLLKNPKLFKAEDTSPMDKEFLSEHFFSLDNFQNAYQGEAFVVDKEARFLTTLNINDHLCFHFLDYRGEIETGWKNLVKIETGLGPTIGYAYSSKFGYLTSEPTQCGTGLQVQVFLQLPGLIHTEMLEEVLEKLTDDSIFVGSLSGDSPHLVGDILLVQNNYTLGVNEENILSSVRNYVTKLIIEENTARSKIKKENPSHIKDLVSRAYGVLTHSYKIEAIEALNAISLLKLGVESGWVEGITIANLNTLFFNCRRGHLLYMIKGLISQEELPHKRAEFIHQILKNVKLVVA